SRVGARIDAIYVCPHHPDDGCACRKPGIAMFQQAAKDFELSLTSSYVVGDRMLDVLSGRAAGSQTILVRSGHRLEPTNGVTPDHEAQDLSEAVAWILQQEGLQAGRGRPLAAARGPSDHAGVQR
ncbi:MAG: HAD-IIIA family hydrolase, partial [Candidatus Omnitrophica bacterium]|nr:HAD-IIIA family hydrolase [Candidatus Omnitrophota bacterium]